MDRTEQLLNLLDGWDEIRDIDRPTPEEFCCEHPDLLDDFREVLRQRGVLSALLTGEDSLAILPESLIDQMQSGRFPIIRFHDKGGLGWVYVARDREFGRTVALKCLQPVPSTDASIRQRFIREAEITARLEHPGIVPIYGMGEIPSQNSPFYTMRLIQGENLRDLIRKFHADEPRSDWKSVAAIRLLRLFVAVCETVAFAHSKNVVHRDLKSGNIMVGAYGETLVLDWGLAKLLTEPDVIAEDINSSNITAPHPSVTQTGATLGTVGFMSPEQARGEWTNVSIPADIFSLGAILYQLLTDRMPYEGRNALEFAKRGSFQAPKTIQPHIPRALNSIVLKAMEAAPQNRYASSNEMKTEIERFLADEPVSARRDSTAEQIQRFFRKHRAAVQWGAVASLATSIMLGVFLWWASIKNDELRAAFRREEDAKNDILRQRNRVQRELLHALKENYAATMGQVSQSLNDGEPTRLEQMITNSRPKLGTAADPRDIEWWMSWAQAFRNTHVIATDDQRIKGVKFVENGRKCALWDGESIRVIDSNSGQELFRQKSIAEYEPSLLRAWSGAELPCSMDGTTIAIANHTLIDVYQTKNGSYEKVDSYESGANLNCSLSSIFISDNGQFVAYHENGMGFLQKHCFKIWNVRTGVRQDIFFEENTSIIDQKLSPDGRFVAYSLLNPNRLVVQEVSTGNTIVSKEPLDQPVRGCSFGQYDTIIGWTDTEAITYGIDFPEQLTPLWKTSFNSELNLRQAANPRDRWSIREWIELAPDGISNVHVVPKPGLRSQGTLSKIRATWLAVISPGHSRLYYREPGGMYAWEPSRASSIRPPDRITELHLPRIREIAAISEDCRTILLCRNDTDLTTTTFETLAMECTDPSNHRGAIRNVAWDSSGNLVSLTEPSKIPMFRSECHRSDVLTRQSSLLSDDHLSNLSTISENGGVLASFDSEGLIVQVFGESTEKFHCLPSMLPTVTNIENSNSVKLYAWNRRVAPRVNNDGASFEMILDNALAPQKGSLNLPWVLLLQNQTNQSRIKKDGEEPNTFLTILDYEASRIVKVLPVHGSTVETLAISRNGRLIAASCSDGCVRTWFVDDDRTIVESRNFPIDTVATCLVFERSDAQLFVGTNNGDVMSLEFATGNQKLVTKAHESKIIAMTVSPDEKRLITAGFDGTVRFFDIGQSSEVFRYFHREVLTSLAMDPKTQTLAIGDAAGHVAVLPVANRSEVFNLANQWLKQKSMDKIGEEAILREFWAEYISRQGIIEEDIENGLNLMESIRSKVRSVDLNSLHEEFLFDRPPGSSPRSYYDKNPIPLNSN